MRMRENRKMECVKCGHEIEAGIKFCPYCGEKIAGEVPGEDKPIYTAEVKGLMKSGRLAVYRDRTELTTSSVQKAIYDYSALVAVKKGLDRILFITEDGRTESCVVSRKNVHEAFLYIEKAARPYIEERRNRLMTEGIRFSLVSSMGLTGGVLNLMDDRAEFRAKSGQIETVHYQDVKKVGLSMGIGALEFSLTDGMVKSFTLDKESREEAFTFVGQAVEPYITARKEELLARGIYFSCPSSFGTDGGTLEVLEDRVEYRSRTGQDETVFFQDVRVVSRTAGMLALSLTDGTSRSFTVDRDIWNEVLDFVEKAVAPYVEKRTAGFDTSFGIDERIEINEERGVFHLLRQGGSQITEECSIEDMVRCEWLEGNLDNMLGGVLSGGMAILSSAAKAAGAQSAPNTEERIGYVGVDLTVRGSQGERTERLRFGDFPLGMSRTNKKYDRYVAEVSGFMDYLGSRCPACELVMPVLPEQGAMAAGMPPVGGVGETAGAGLLTGIIGSVGNIGRSAGIVGGTEPAGTAGIAATAGPSELSESAAAAERDRFGLQKYIEGVSGFISECTTPMTIAIQGSWGSGRNSILQMLSDSLEETYRGNQVWFHAWQFFQSASGEQLPMQVGNKLIGQLGGAGGGAAKDRMIKVTKGLINITSGFISQGSTDGQNFTDALFREGSADSLEKTVRDFSELIRKRAGESGKVILFVDGLDRLAPAEGVELLEAMRDFFDCEGCVFVIAVDYNTVIRGAEERYGQDFDEKKEKSFFDKLFQVSFRVPVSGFNIQNYVQDKLEHIGINAEEKELNFYVELIRHSVGSDPKTMDRLFNSFLLLKKLAEEELYESKERRLMLFSLLCMQTRFHDIYELIVRMKDKVTPEFLSGLCEERAEVLAGYLFNDGEKEAFRKFATVFCNVINTDRQGGISEEECGVFGEVLEFSAITSK